MARSAPPSRARAAPDLRARSEGSLPRSDGTPTSSGTAAGVDRPDVDELIASHAVIVVELIQCGVAMRHDPCSEATELGRIIAARRQLESAEFVAEAAVGR